MSYKEKSPEYCYIYLYTDTCKPILFHSSAIYMALSKKNW